MEQSKFIIYLFVAATTTYLIRMLPLLLIKKKIANKFVVSFLYYIPYAVLSVMTIPAVFYATDYYTSAVIGVIAGIVAAYLGQSLLRVACLSCLVVFIAESIIGLM
ncbi:MAG: AzlD domain-containing protein [Clostridia bacterium]|nr:AzlD domain-containing protein [Clostridia bacterium]